MYKDSKWAKEIVSIQDENGLWGYFHTLSEPNKTPLTTEQALRRLQILGYTINDNPILKTVEYMNDCLMGKKQMPDRREKIHDWEIFTNLMLSTWIKRFTNDSDKANQIAATWASIISSAFADDGFNHAEYVSSYINSFGMKPQGGRLIDFNNFYHVSLIADQLDKIVEARVFDYLLNHKNGIYYIYDRPIGNAYLCVLPEKFATKISSRYIGAIELLSQYRNNLHKFEFVIKWIDNNRNDNGKWDMSSSVNDKVYFPLSDTWQRKEIREADCTYRIQNLINSLCPAK